jgi:hypothetical protein
MNAMLPGQNPLQQHMKWAADQQKAFLDRRREEAGYEEWKRRPQGKRPRPTPGPPPPPPPWQPWQGAGPAPLAPMPAPRVERHHPVRALFTFLVMLALTAVAMLMADEVINALVALVVVGGVGLVLTFLAMRSSWRDR